MEKRTKATETKEATRTNGATQPDTPRSHYHIRKTLLRKAIPYILVGCIASSAVMMSYNEAEEVKAEAITITALTVCALLAVMATMGITYATQNILETWEDGNNALDPDFEDIYEDWGYNYDTELQLLLEQQGSSGGGNDEDLPPDFDTLMKRIEIAGNTAVITAGAWNLLKKSGKTLLQKSYELGTLFADSTIPDGMNVPIEDINKSTAIICTVSDIYRVDTIMLCTNVPIAIVPDYSCIVTINSDSDKYITSKYYKGESVYTGTGFLSNVGGGYLYAPTGFQCRQIHSFSKFMSKHPTFNTVDEAVNYLKQQNIAMQDEPIWVTPELQDIYENKGEFEFPENMPDSLRIPNIDDLQELARRLNPDSNPDYNPEEIPEYIKQYINDLKVDPNPNPDPNPDPNPNPDPDNPDKPTNPDTPTNNDTFLADLKHLFPFCIPFDLVDCFKLFNAEPVTPRVEIPVHFGIINYDHTFVIDLKDFNSVAVVCRSAFLIIYMAGLILATRALIKG
jgi:hypothetical protein